MSGSFSPNVIRDAIASAYCELGCHGNTFLSDESPRVCMYVEICGKRSLSCIITSMIPKEPYEAPSESGGGVFMTSADGVAGLAGCEQCSIL